MKAIIFLLISLFLFSGCTATQNRASYLVSVNSIAKPNIDQMAKGRKYFIAHADDEGSVFGGYDLQFYEYAKYIDHILIKNGYIKVKSIGSADFVIYLKYGITSKTKASFSNRPIYGKKGISSITTSGISNSYINVNNNSNFNMNTYSNSTSYVNYDYGIIGYKTEMHQYKEYNRYISLWAKKIKSRFLRGTLNRHAIFWQMNITSNGSSGDFRRVFPVMIAASKDYFLKNSNHTKTIRIFEDDISVLEIKGIPIKKK